MRASGPVCAVAATALALSAPAVALARQASEPLQVSRAATATAPLEITKTRHLAVQVLANGQGPFRMILDTGSPISFIGTAMARRLGLVAPNSGPSGFLGMRLGVKLKSLSLGDATLHDQPVMVLDHPTVEMLAQVNGPLEGIVGLNVLSRFRFTIDYGAAQLSLTPVDYQPRDVVADVMGRLVTRLGGNPVVAPGALWGMVVEKPDARAGVRVSRVYAGSPIAASGLRVGDRILTLDRRWTDSVAECYEAASLVRPGRAVAVRFVRAGVSREAIVKPVVGL